MKVRHTWLRGAVLAVLIVAMATIGVSSAGARPKGGFTPYVGNYRGIFKNEGSSVTAYGGVHKKGNQYSVFLAIPVPVTCTNEGVSGGALLEVQEEVKVKGRSFSFKGKTPGTGDTVNNLYINLSMKGHFTSTKSFTVTVNASTSVEPEQQATTVACSGSPVTVQMKAGA
ncbi:MAG TPA: hypothetical protein VMF55_07670 [Solirubrobacterales bacterium]|nr:hypothetical protein [Solirubrobacterales bacterium]